MLTLQAGAAAAEPGHPPATVRFDIAPQPLPKALHAFSAATGIEILVESRNIASLTVGGLRGAMQPQTALRQLLAGTGLVATSFSAETVTLAPMAPPAPPSPAVGAHPYFALVQSALLQALCRGSDTAPGTYRLAVALWIDATGVVARAARLDSTGDGRRDAALDVVLDRLPIGQRPPPGLPQPVTVVVLPRAAHDRPDCGTPGESRSADMWTGR